MKSHYQKMKNILSKELMSLLKVLIKLITLILFDDCSFLLTLSFEFLDLNLAVI